MSSIHNTAAPRELLFLVDQFHRLAQRNIPVFWSGGSIDSTDNWPSYISWPNNRPSFSNRPHRAPSARNRRDRGLRNHRRQPRRVATHPALRFRPTSPDLFSIAVAHANWNAGALGEIGTRYWALGGPHNRSTPLESNCVAHFAGSPQGRCSAEAGPHGCTIVSVDEHSHVQLNPLACDVLRWHTMQLALPATADPADLEKLLHDRTTQLVADSGGTALMLSWQVACHGSLRFALGRGSLGSELVRKLRQEFGQSQSPVWTLPIEVELPDQLPAAWHEEQTLRGDFLRAVRQCSHTLSSIDAGETVFANPASPALGDYPPPETPLELHLPENFADLLPAENRSAISNQLPEQLAAPLHPSAARDRLLREVACLGADLLSPAEATT